MLPGATASTMTFCSSVTATVSLVCGSGTVPMTSTWSPGCAAEPTDGPLRRSSVMARAFFCTLAESSGSATGGGGALTGSGVGGRPQQTTASTSTRVRFMNEWMRGGAKR